MKISQLLALALSVVLVGVQTNVHSQGNLVSLYDWTVNWPAPTSTNYMVGESGGVSINSSNSAQIASGVYYYWTTTGNGFGGWASGWADNPILTGNINTTPGASYEITCSAWNECPLGGDNLAIAFGNFTNIFNLPEAAPSGTPYFWGVPTNIDFIITATSTVTTMSINPGYISDNATGPFYLSDLAVTEVPEISLDHLFGIGCLALLAHQSRTILQKRAVSHAADRRPKHIA